MNGIYHFPAGPNIQRVFIVAIDSDGRVIPANPGDLNVVGTAIESSEEEDIDSRINIELGECDRSLPSGKHDIEIESLDHSSQS